MSLIRKIALAIVATLLASPFAHAERMYDGSGRNIGRLEGERLYDGSGRQIGRAEGLRRRQVIVFFYFFM